MSPKQRQRAEKALEASLDMAAGERERFLAALAKEDPEVAAEVASLMASEAHPDLDALLRNDPDDDITLGPGVVIGGRYRLERPIANGNFAYVWLAADTELRERPVLVKMLKHVDDEWFAESFEKEVDILSRIRHPGIVRPLGTGRTGRRPFIAMDYVQGKTLREYMSNKPVPLRDWAPLLRKMSAAVEAAHSHGVCHCDLKPENVIIEILPEGGEEPRLIDFGIARIREGQKGWKTTQHIAGTLSYMAPEQLEGRARKETDIYALAVISYEALTGRKPFDAETLPDLLRQQQAGAPNAQRLQPELPSAGMRILSAALAVDPKDRPDSAASFGSQLADVLERAATSPRKNQIAAPLLALGGILTIAFAAWMATAARVVRTPSLHETATRAIPAHLAEIVDQSGAASGESDGVYRVRGGFRIRLNPSRPGHVYLFSEAAIDPKGMTVLFPSPESASLVQKAVTIPEGSSFAADSVEPQNLWVVWSAKPVPLFEEAVRWENSTDRGAIRDTKERVAIRSLLSTLPRKALRRSLLRL